MGKKFKITIELIDNEADESQEIEDQKKALEDVIKEDLSNYAFEITSVSVEESV